MKTKSTMITMKMRLTFAVVLMFPSYHTAYVTLTTTTTTPHFITASSTPCLLPLPLLHVSQHWTYNHRHSSSALKSETKDTDKNIINTRELCAIRNVPLKVVKNARDLSSVFTFESPDLHQQQHSSEDKGDGINTKVNINNKNSINIAPRKLIRCGRLSDASTEDISILFDEFGIRTLVDLRSPTELKEDTTLERQDVYSGFDSFIWLERKGGSVVKLREGEPRIRHKHNGGDEEDHDGGNKRKSGGGPLSMLAGLAGKGMVMLRGNNRETRNRTTPSRSPASDMDVITAAADLAVIACGDCDGDIDSSVMENVVNTDSDEAHSTSRVEKEYPPNTIHSDSNRSTRRERHFVSLMDEMKYLRGTLSRLRKRDIAVVLAKSPGALVSSRIRRSCKDVFLNEINGGGLPMLNELLLRFGAPGIRYVLELCADETRHPIAFYCTAGKDRTGMISAIILSLLGVPESDIVVDYSLSAEVYAQMGDHTAMVGALSQRNLNPETFLGAPPDVMIEILRSVRESYGSVEGYCDWIGFDKKDRERLRNAMLTK